MSACGSQAKAFDNTEDAATVTAQAGVDVGNGTEDVPTPTQAWTPIPPTEIPPTIVVPPTVAATETPISTPEYVQTFLDLGFDKKSTDSDKYVLYDESSVHYLPGKGIVFNERIIRSWAMVDYLEDNVWKRGIVINTVVRGGNGPSNDYGKFIMSSSLKSGMDALPTVWIEGINKGVNEHVDEGGHPIMHTSITAYPNTGENQLYEGIFPMVDGLLQPVTIPGIGTVLPFCELRLPEVQIYE